MEEKKVFYIVVSLVLLAGLGLFFAVKNLKYSPDEPRSNLDCNLLYKGSDSGVNIVIFASQSDAEKYKNYFFEVSPYDKNQDMFNFYYIDNYEPPCSLYKGVALFCYSTEIIKKASSCPNDFIVALGSEANQIRSSSYQNVMSINKNSPMSVFPHEFGHAFASLDEEYTPARVSSDSPNCKSSCDRFDSENDGCYEGCSRSDFFRSADQGIMRTLYSQEYGKYDESVILDQIAKYKTKKSTITGNVVNGISNCKDKRYYLIIGNIVDDKAIVISKTSESGCSDGVGAGDYGYYLIGINGSIIGSSLFNSGELYTESQNKNQDMISGEVYTDYNQFIIKVPDIDGATELKILNRSMSEIKSLSLNDIDRRVCRIS